MNILQYFHKKEKIPMFNIGDIVRLKKDLSDLVSLYNETNTRFPTTVEKSKESRKYLAEILGESTHQVTKVTEGTPAAGGWFVYVDGESLGYHGNIFELA